MDAYQFYFLIGCSILFFLIGCFGNIISIVIFNNKDFKTQPTTTYIIASNIVNIITMVYLPYIILPELWTDLYSETISCQLFDGIMTTLVEIQSWIYTLCSFDRCITAVYPHKFLFKNKKNFQSLIILILSVIILVLISVFIYFYEKIDIIESNLTKTICTFPSNGEYSWVFTYVQVCNYLCLIYIIFII